jgi:nucleotide-binding universal stress UspA family protein
MFTKILLPVDLSDRHGRALEVAAQLAGRGGGSITLLHVIEVIAGASRDEEKGFYGRLEKAARRHLDGLGQVLAQRQATCQKEIILGNRGPEILRYAGGKGVDLIVLTSPRLDPADPGAGLGSLSYKIGYLAPCPVLLVR